MQPVEAAVEHNITYRQLLSNNLGVRDPLRVIALCDSDAFYAACEMVRLGVDKETPLVVLQWDSLIAVNYPARTYGISRMCKLKDALKLCPHLRVVHVATYKEGEKEPGYWDDVDTTTHKAFISPSSWRHCSWALRRSRLTTIEEKVPRFTPRSKRIFPGLR
jgi:nucleotidyltransferase/DNA polymerase involved in DNA repair